MIVISKAEAKYIREKFPHAHMVTTVHKTMVDEIPEIMKALPNNINAQEALKEINQFEGSIYNVREGFMYE